MTTASSSQEKSPLFVGVDLAKAVFQTAYVKYYEEDLRILS